jgi:chromosomal replication initiation ATPase DnaA
MPAPEVVPEPEPAIDPLENYLSDDEYAARIPVVFPVAHHMWIMRVVAHRYQITVSQLKGASRHKGYVVPRHIAIFLMIHAGLSFPRATLAVGRTDHTTALYAFKKVGKRMASEPAFDAQIRALAADCSVEVR